jgi:hypothetical protein
MIWGEEIKRSTVAKTKNSILQEKKHKRWIFLNQSLVLSPSPWRTPEILLCMEAVRAARYSLLRFRQPQQNAITVVKIYSSRLTSGEKKSTLKKG